VLPKTPKEQQKSKKDHGVAREGIKYTSRIAQQGNGRFSETAITSKHEQ
jgi:hypothetical protein